MNQKQKVYSLVSTLLQYPESEWKKELQNLDVVHEFPDESIRMPILRFLTYVKNTSFHNLCENYVYTFDFYDKTTLYLTHTVFKDNRDRGTVLSQMRRQMMELGMEFTTEELPDYLPLILEFASIVPEKDSAKILNLHLRSIKNLELELQGIDSPYRYLVAACIQCIEMAEENEKVS